MWNESARSHRPSRSLHGTMIRPAVLFICLAAIGATTPLQKLIDGVTKWDTDQDGRLSRDELHSHVSNLHRATDAAEIKRLEKAARASFKVLIDERGSDKDGDGALSLEELQHERSKLHQEAEASEKASGDFDFRKFRFIMPWGNLKVAPANQGRRIRGQAAKDSDGDDELAAHDRELLVHKFHFADVDHNGKLTVDEFGRFCSPNSPKWHEDYVKYGSKADITALDADGDGKLSVGEFTSQNTVSKILAAEDTFSAKDFQTQLDKDKDGFVTFEELVKGRIERHAESPAAVVDENLLKPGGRFDQDGDGHLSVDEVRYHYADLEWLLPPEHEEL